MHNKELLLEQKKSFEHDLKVMEKEVNLLIEKIKSKEIDTSEPEIFTFYTSKLTQFIESKQQIKKFLEEIDEKLKEIDKK